MSLEDIYGRRVRLKRVRANTPGILPADTFVMKTILIDEETGQELTSLFDTGTHLLQSQADGTYLVSRLVKADDTPRLPENK